MPKSTCPTGSFTCPGPSGSGICWALGTYVLSKAFLVSPDRLQCIMTPLHNKTNSQTSNIRCTNSQNLKCFSYCLKLFLLNPLGPCDKSRMKMLLEQCRQAMLQLHESSTILLPTKVHLYKRFECISYWWFSATVVSPLLMQWRYCILQPALIDQINTFCVPIFHITGNQRLSVSPQMDVFATVTTKVVTKMGY